MNVRDLNVQRDESRLNMGTEVEHSWTIIDSLKDSIDGQAPELYPVHSWGPESSRIYG